ncbi:MAG TPA: DUF2306 domain-containing protein [Rhizomicrobium sp.]|nr:DUF2306 domain-containing protein [Rhizomicrobium sp.]
MHGPLAYLHVAAALIALLSGLFVVFWRKGKALHRLLGIVYVFAMLQTNVSALMIYHLTGRFGLFHVFALLSMAYTLAGLAMPILRRQGWLNAHVQWMSWSYLSLLAASLNELLIRLPLHVNTPPCIFAVGAILGLSVLAAGLALRPRLRRAALRHAP